MADDQKPEQPPTRELYDRLDGIDAQIATLQSERTQVAAELRSRLGRKKPV